MLAFIFSHINFINCIIKSFAVIPFPSSIQVYFTHLFPLYQNHHFVYNRVESSTLCILYTEFNSIKWRKMRMHCLCDNPRLCFFYSLNFISFFITFHLLRFFYAKFLFFPSFINIAVTFLIIGLIWLWTVLDCYVITINFLVNTLLDSFYIQLCFYWKFDNIKLTKRCFGRWGRFLITYFMIIVHWMLSLIIMLLMLTIIRLLLQSQWHMQSFNSPYQYSLIF